ncbi:hypothetical protein [Rhodophyticola porphyridii]|uniref:hypothetical protein n=1 Tax=Rhodophyticola porphyridii TaxID=1852017 RepID=UPI0011C3E03A|nr:hypothetical protein [Rhodophyticola porphyridii]
MENAYYLATGTGFFIPAESTIWTFRVVRMNEGSGEWWAYAVDAANHYALLPSGQEGYLVLPKSVVPRGFVPFDTETWIGATWRPITRVDL